MGGGDPKGAIYFGKLKLQTDFIRTKVMQLYTEIYNEVLTSRG